MTGCRQVGSRLAWLCVLALITACDVGPPGEPAYDILIRGATLYDGSLADGRPGNVAIRGARIAALDVADDAPARLVIDARGLAVVPGFIDPHTHALADLLNSDTAANENYLQQGVTTVFVGNDGDGVSDRDKQFARMREQGTGTNVGFFAGHGDLRRRVLGLENRAATADEMLRMQALLDIEMQAGALGLSTGLFYTPGSYAATGEVVALARVAARYGGVYDTHMRSESSVAPGLMHSIEEVLTIARDAHIAVHISHLKALGRDLWGTSGDIIELIDNARAEGLTVTANQYPYRASGTRFSAALVPQWARADSTAAMFARFDNPDLAARLHEEMADNLRVRGGPDAMLVTDAGSEWRGMTLTDIAERLRTDPLAAAVHAIRDGDPSIASFVMREDDIEAIAIQPWVMTGSDGSSGHPRKYATYPKAYLDFVVDRPLLTTSRFVHRSSGLVADTFGLCDRGYLEAGRRADIAIVDFKRYRPRADFEHQTVLAEGVAQLIVNGVPTIRNGQYAGALGGEIIDRQHLDCLPKD